MRKRILLLSILVALVLFTLFPRGISITSSGWVSISTSNYVYANPAPPVYVDKTVTGTASGDGITFTAPSFSAGNAFIVFIYKDDDVLINEHGDWITLHNVTSGTGCAIYCAYRIAQVGDTEWTWTGDSESYGGILICYSGNDTTTPINVSGVAVNTSNAPTAPDILTTVDDCMIFSAFGADDDDIPYTQPLTNERFNTSYSTSGGAGGDQIQANQGQTGTFVFSMNAVEEWGAVTVAVQPPSGAVPDIVNLPTTWTLNGIVNGGNIQTDTVYYSNPQGDTQMPASTVADADCRFTITNSSTMAIDLTCTMGSFSGGDANMTNSNLGTNGATTYGAYSWFSGQLYANKVIIKSSDSSVGYDGLGALTDIKWGVEVETQTDAWAGGTPSTATLTITATVD